MTNLCGGIIELWSVIVWVPTIRNQTAASWGLLMQIEIAGMRILVMILRTVHLNQKLPQLNKKVFFVLQNLQ